MKLDSRHTLRIKKIAPILLQTSTTWCDWILLSSTNPPPAAVRQWLTRCHLPTSEWQMRNVCSFFHHPLQLTMQLDTYKPERPSQITDQCHRMSCLCLLRCMHDCNDMYNEEKTAFLCLCTYSSNIDKSKASTMK